jgi:predicted ATPase
LVILLDPGPARLVVLEEPELGLHPDVLPTLRDLLREGSERFQLVVTTHSVQLLDALTEAPQAVVVCEKIGATSSLRRLVPQEVDRLREFGTLGTLWLSGQLGGTRW